MRQMPGPTGRMKNCNSWAEYESGTATATARLCNGGHAFEADYSPCPSLEDCKRLTSIKTKKTVAYSTVEISNKRTHAEIVAHAQAMGREYGSGVFHWRKPVKSSVLEYT